MTNYHIRSNYEILLKSLILDSGDTFDGDFERYSDYQLLININNQLKKLNCIQFTYEEMNEIAMEMN